MNLFHSSDIHRIELLVPVLKDLSYLDLFDASAVAGALRGDPLKQLMLDTNMTRMETRAALLATTDGAMKALEERVREVSASVMLLEIQERLNFYLQDADSSPKRKALNVWRDLCCDASYDEPIVQDLPLILLHAPEAWRRLEKALHAVSLKVFVGQNFVRGRFEEDGTIDLSLMYTAFCKDNWRRSFPKSLSTALDAFCQREFFAMVDDRPALYKI